jgi:hypothetical protein
MVCHVCVAVAVAGHLHSLEASGYPVPLADWGSHVCAWVAQFSSGALLVLLGWGWTLTP